MVKAQPWSFVWTGHDRLSASLALNCGTALPDGHILCVLCSGIRYPTRFVTTSLSMSLHNHFPTSTFLGHVVGGRARGSHPHLPSPPAPTPALPLLGETHPVLGAVLRLCVRWGRGPSLRQSVNSLARPPFLSFPRYHTCNSLLLIQAVLPAFGILSSRIILLPGKAILNHCKKEASTTVFSSEYCVFPSSVLAQVFSGELKGKLVFQLRTELRETQQELDRLLLCHRDWHKQQYRIRES